MKICLQVSFLLGMEDKNGELLLVLQSMRGKKNFYFWLTLCNALYIPDVCIRRI